jgi:hypothetical protein
VTNLKSAIAYRSVSTWPSSCATFSIPLPFRAFTFSLLTQLLPHHLSQSLLVILEPYTAAEYTAAAYDSRTFVHNHNHNHTSRYSDGSQQNHIRESTLEDLENCQYNITVTISQVTVATVSNPHNIHIQVMGLRRRHRREIDWTGCWASQWGLELSNGFEEVS